VTHLKGLQSKVKRCFGELGQVDKADNSYVEAAMSVVGVTDWMEEQQRRKWRWTGHELRRKDGKWTKTNLSGSPMEERGEAII